MAFEITGQGACMAYLYKMGRDNLAQAVQAGNLSKFIHLQGLKAMRPTGIRNRDTELEQQPMTTATITPILRQARTAMPANVTLKNPGMPDEGYQRLPGASGKAASRGSLRLTDAVPSLPETGERALQTPGTTETLAMSILQRSRIAQAGARLIPVELAPEPGGVNSSWNRAGGFSVISGATFAQGDDVSPLTAQALPVTSADIDLDQMEQYGVRFELSRRTQKDTPASELDAKVIGGIAYGIAELVDRVALEALEAKLLEAGGGASMPPFSMAAAAAKGLRFDELRAIVGTDATGHQVEDGKLRVRGFPAEFTGEHAATFAGAFDRLGVAVMDDIRILVERTRLDGALAVTCWVDVLPLVPDAGYFWQVSS